MIAERPISLVTVDGSILEARLAMPGGAAVGVAICHPHPLYGGNMDNPVVQRIVEACAEAEVATLRFNFRGVEGSTGSHDAGRAEMQDLAAALDHLAGLLRPDATAAAGYSFGAMVTAAVAARRPGLRGIALVAPPLARAAIAAESLRGAPATLVVVGSHDDYCPPAAATALTSALPGAEVRVIAGADHFFGGALGPLGDAVSAWARALRARNAAGSRRSG
jgi:alpha/beta superfamily hydrolase